MVSKTTKDFIVGVSVVVITGYIMSIWLEINLVLSLIVASLLGVIAGFLTHKLQGG